MTAIIARKVESTLKRIKKNSSGLNEMEKNVYGKDIGWNRRIEMWRRRMLEPVVEEYINADSSS